MEAFSSISDIFNEAVLVDQKRFVQIPFIAGLLDKAGSFIRNDRIHSCDHCLLFNEESLRGSSPFEGGEGEGGEAPWDHARVARERTRECKVRFAHHIRWRGCSDGFSQLRQVAICSALVRALILAHSYILRTGWRPQRGIYNRRENRAHFHSWAVLCLLEAPAKTICGQFVVWWTFCLVTNFISFLDNS